MSWSVIAFDRNGPSVFESSVVEYLKRINYWHKVDLKKIMPCSFKDVEQSKNKDFEHRVENKNFIDRQIVVIDLNGNEYNSEKFAQKTGEWINSAGKLNFIIGPSYGLSKKWRDGALDVISLTKFTLTHELAQLIFIEQLYRAFCILKNHPYH